MSNHQVTNDYTADDDSIRGLSNCDIINSFNWKFDVDRNIEDKKCTDVASTAEKL